MKSVWEKEKEPVVEDAKHLPDPHDEESDAALVSSTHQRALADAVAERMRESADKEMHHQSASDTISPRMDEVKVDQRPSGANARQVGGQHYGGTRFQHWDMVVAFDLDYFQGQITKYVLRWNKKNGIEDLKKAKHFLEKYIEEIEAGRITQYPN